MCSLFDRDAQERLRGCCPSFILEASATPSIHLVYVIAENVSLVDLRRMTRGVQPHLIILCIDARLVGIATFTSVVGM